MSEINLEIIDSINKISASEWNELHQSQHPFIQHAFLSALESNDCASPKYGWHPCHAIFKQNNQVIAALPLYRKTNNYGEFVFDHAWSHAFDQIGLPYYPKLVSSTPYTPALGPKFLARPKHLQLKGFVLECFELLKAFAEKHHYSGLHLLFSKENKYFNTPEVIKRTDVQFQWFNQNYHNFDDYLATLKSKKRKNIRQERRSITNQEIVINLIEGKDTDESHWEAFNIFYQKCFLDKFSTPTLNLPFFLEISKNMPEHIVLVMATHKNQMVAGALFFKSNKVLYGRHWGCIKEFKNLHFETCFYQGIEYAIQNGLQRFEPGAGGEHKISRGFVPVIMQSKHWLTINPFVQAIERFVQEEELMINNYAQQIWQTSPYSDISKLQEKAQSHLSLIEE